MLVEESGVECSDYLHDYDQWTLAMCVRKQGQTSVRQYYLQIYRSRFVEKVSGCLLSVASNIIMKYLQTIFFSVFETAWLSQTIGLCFVCLFSVTRALFGLELDLWRGALLYWNVQCMCNRDHEWYLMQFMTNAWVSKTFFFHQCIYRILKCNRCQRLYFTSSDQQWYKIYYTLVHWFLTGIRWQLW